MTTNPTTTVDLDLTASDYAPLPTDAKRQTRWGWWIVLLGLGGFVLWAVLAPLDKGVPLTGTVTVAGNKKAVQHQAGGTVEAILVKEGDTVKAGQVLARMNSVQARANAEITRVQYFTARSAEARLLAERDGRASVAFPNDVAQASDDARVAATMTVQQQLFTSRQSALRSELAAMDENIAGIRALHAGLLEAMSSKREQMRLLGEQLANIRSLAQEGYVPRNRLLELERTYAQLASSLSEDTGNMGRNNSQIAEIQMRRMQRQQDFQKEVRAELAEVQKEADALRNRLEGLDFEVANALVKAPVDGVVADVSIFTEGGVVAPGFRMMDVVPLSEPLIVEGQVPVHLVDSVQPQLPVELIFSAFNQNTTPRVPAVVTQVSPDRLVDEKTGMPYYRMRAEVTAEGRTLMSSLPVRAGMPVDLFVRTGERTLMNYLFRPLQDNFKMALTEE